MTDMIRPASPVRAESAVVDDSTWVVYVKKQQPPMVVRFLTEPDQWLEFQEIYDQVNRVYQPVSFDYDGETKPAFRYLAAAVLVDDDKARALKLPYTLGTALRNIHQQAGTICDRDFQLIVTGEGLTTTYLPYPNSPQPRPVEKYTMPDLTAAFESYCEYAAAKANGVPPPATTPVPEATPEPEVTSDPFDPSRDWSRVELAMLPYGQLQEVVKAKGGSPPENAAAASLVDEIMIRQDGLNERPPDPMAPADESAVAEMRALLDDDPEFLEALEASDLQECLVQLGQPPGLAVKPALIKRIKDLCSDS